MKCVAIKIFLDAVNRQALSTRKPASQQASKKTKEIEKKKAQHVDDC
jgi:hypothetical protein